MAYSFPADVKELVEQQMATGRFATEDELIREALDALSAESTEVAAIQAAIDEWQAGDPGLPLDEAFDSVRRNRGPARSA